jgi:hypothetical protein
LEVTVNGRPAVDDDTPSVKINVGPNEIYNPKRKPITSVLEAQPKLGVLVGLEAEPKLQISVAVKSLSRAEIHSSNSDFSLSRNQNQNPKFRRS